MITFQQESLLATGLGQCIKNGVIGFANAKLFGVTDNPQAGAIYSLCQSAIINAFIIPHVYFLGEKIRHGAIDMSELMAKQPVLAAGFAIYCSAILAVGIFGGRYLANQYDLRYNEGKTPLSYRQVAVLEIVRMTETSIFGF